MGLRQSTRRGDLTVDTRTAFARYEAIRAALPDANFPSHSRKVMHLGAWVGEFDTILLDAFGVLNIGETAIPGAVDFITAIRRTGGRVMILSNSAGVPTAASLAKFHRLGFDITADEIVTSRDALKAALAAGSPRRWGVMAGESSQIDELGVDVCSLGDADAPYDDADGFILLGSAGWTPTRQDRLAEALLSRPRPVLVGNPDLVAPRENGLSLEPGWFAHDLADRVRGYRPVFHGKPFGDIFDLALARLGDVDPARTLMVGDTLHTDILGGAAAGLRTCLLCNYGFLAGQDTDALIAQSAIRPDLLSSYI